MAPQRAKLRLLKESRDLGAPIDSILERIKDLRDRMGSEADPGYGFGDSSGGGAGPKSSGGAEPKTEKKPNDQGAGPKQA